MVLGGFALALIVLGLYTTALDSLRNRLVDLTAALYWVSDLPSQAGQWVDNRMVSNNDLQLENNALRSENLILMQKLQKSASVEAENLRLRQLLNASEAIEDRVLIAELIGVTPDPQVHKIILNRGTQHGVHLGQAVLDAFGLMGQVVELGEQHCVVLLLTDPTHATPVQINRNGVRLVAEGVGDLYSLHLRHVVSTIDIQVGDLLVSSGLGRRFPAGYPVARVTQVTADPGQAFVRVLAEPMAQLNRSRHVLLVFERERGG